MNIITLIFYIFCFEMFLILITVMIMIVYYFYIQRAAKIHEVTREKLRKTLLKILSNEEPIQKEGFVHPSISPRDLLVVLESFNRRFSDYRWQEIKQTILTKEFMQNIRKMASHSSWIKRDLAARFLRLAPEPQDESILLKLIEDPNSMVRIQAALCAVQIATKSLIYKILYRITKESLLARYPYRDALIHSDKRVFSLVEEIMQEGKDGAIDSVCLDILSTHMHENLMPFVEKYLESDNLDNKISVIKILTNLPQKKSVDYLIHCLYNKDWQVRAEAAQGLGRLASQEATPHLANALNDVIWHVRLEAALALKKLGEQGFIILSRQDPDINLQAYETAQYVLALPA